MSRRVLITGAAGFVGANLVRRRLAVGDDVHLVVRPGTDRWRLRGIETDAPVHTLDLVDRDAVESVLQVSAPEIVFHLAAHGAYSFQTQTEKMLATNVTGTTNLLLAALRRGFDSFINTGSSSEYGEKDHAPGEEEPCEPNSDYAATKLCATILCRELARRHEAPVVTLRLYSVYGPFEDPRRLIPTVVRAGQDRKWPPLADPGVVRDFVYVDDVVDAYALAADHAVEPGAVFNVGTGTQTTLGELCDIAARMFGITEPPPWSTYERRAWDTATWVSNPAQIGRELGWRARHDIESGLVATAAWSRAAP